MKAYVLKGIGQFDYEEVPLPILKAGEALVEVHASGICGSDIPRIFETGAYHFPLIPGHEFSGKVVDVSESEHNGWMHKRVGVFPLIPCQDCFPCQEKNYEMCRSYDYLGSRSDGGFAEYVAVPVWNLIELPEDMTYEEAALLEPASVALHAVRRLTLSGGKTAALYGLGAIGILIVQWLHLYGIKSICALGHHARHGRLVEALTGGACRYQNSNDRNPVEWILEETNGQGADIVVDCVSTSQSLSDSLRCARPGGQVLIVGNPKNNISLDKNIYWKLLRHQLQLYGTWNSSFLHDPEDDWHTAITECTAGNLDLNSLVTHRLEFNQLKEGLSIMKDKKEYHNKIIICR